MKPTKNQLKDMVDLAKDIATNAHNGQKRWNGDAYITHPERIANSLKRDEEKIVGWLHDVLEDTDLTSDDLIRHGIPKQLVESIESLTHKPDESYCKYIQRVYCNNLAMRVKIADIQDNLSSLAASNRRDKYELALLYLQTHRIV